jgi:hypothetical protein
LKLLDFQFEEMKNFISTRLEKVQGLEAPPRLTKLYEIMEPYLKPNCVKNLIICTHSFTISRLHSTLKEAYPELTFTVCFLF